MEKGLLQNKYAEMEMKLHPDCKKLIQQWESIKEKYAQETFGFQVRDKVIQLPLLYKSLSGSLVRKVYLPRYSDCLLYTARCV